MRDWIDRLFEKERHKLADIERFNNECRIKRALAPYVWELIKHDLIEKATRISNQTSTKIRFNQPPVCDILTLEIDGEVSRSMCLNFEEKAPCIFYAFWGSPEDSKPANHIPFIVEPDGNFLSVEYLGKVVPCDRLVEALLDKLIFEGISK